MRWTQNAALAAVLLGCTSTTAIAGNVDLIGANLHAGRQKVAQQTSASKPATDSSTADSNDTSGGQWIADQQTGCRAFDANYDDGDQLSWSGSCSKGLAEGAGTLSFSNGGKVLETVVTNLHRGAIADGHIVASWADGSKYDGEEKDGHMNGHGVFTTAQGDRLEGEWTNDSLAGNVRIQWADGDRYEGDWHDGKANGSGTEIWANGDRYDGEWHDGKAEGMGSQKWADGRSYNGPWSNDLPLNEVTRVAATAPPASGPALGPDTASPSAPLAAASPAMTSPASTDAGLAANTPSQSDAAPSQTKVAILEGLAGTRFMSVDDSSIAFTANETGFVRQIARPDGAMLATPFVFINDRLGTVTNSDGSQTIGIFRVKDSEIDVDYADGRTEVLTPNPGGGLSIALTSPAGQAYCMSWYPQGHVFSDAERKAAVAAYASRLGEQAAPSPARAGSCMGAELAKPDAATHATLKGTVLRNVPSPVPKPTRVSYETVTPVTPAPSLLSPRPAFAKDLSGIVVVRESNVHTIDAGADPKAPASPQAAREPSETDASTCLSVESDGTHWGFRNSCGYNIQFAYCLVGGPGEPASCADGGATGSVAPNSFGALVADKTIQEAGGEHDFRWVGCQGGAGEVVPHLDHADPPAGRCVKPKAS